MHVLSSCEVHLPLFIYFFRKLAELSDISKSLKVYQSWKFQQCL